MGTFNSKVSPQIGKAGRHSVSTGIYIFATYKMMSGLRRPLLMACLLIPSLICSGTGIWVGYQAALGGNHELARWGLILFLSGMTVVPATLVIMVNRFCKSERIRLVSSQRDLSSVRIKKMEKHLSHAKFTKRHPGIIFSFCVFALIVSTGMTLVPLGSPDHRQAVFLHWMGIILGMAYFLILLLVSYVFLTKRWHPYMDSSVQKLEARIAAAKQKQEIDPNPPEPGD
jgi:hypothetical protein